ncbi:MAG: adenylate/guanylate cyclase domain-containing protein, partial [Polyangiales bacterium]
YANYSVLGTVSLMFSTGTPLAKVLSLNERYEPLVRRTHDSFSIETHRLWREATRTMLNDSTELLEPSAEENALRHFDANGNQTALTYFWVLKTQLHYFDEDYATAYESGMRAKAQSESVLGQIVVADLFFYLGLSAAALAKSEPNHRRKYTNTLEDCKRRFRKWAAGSSENFGQQYELLCAELESVNGKNALDAYERTMRSAANNGFLHVEALANELAADHLEREGRDELADVFSERAWRLYREWNGYRKARCLSGKHTHLHVLDEVANHQNRRTSARSESVSTSAPRPVRATDSIGDLLEELCREANADWGAVFRFTDGGLAFESARDTTRDAGSVRASAIVRYVAKSGAKIVIRDCAEDTRFTQCPYLAKHKPRSVFCKVLGDAKDPTGVVYLENRSMPNIFSDVTITATQAYLAAIETSIARDQMLAELRARQLQLDQTQHVISKLEQHRDHLGKFVPVPVRRLLAENPDAPDMVRQERDVSVMFVDIAGYTQMSELLGKESVEYVLDTYFSSFIEEIWDRHGEIVDTAGDGFMAVFESPSHETLAVEAAIALQACNADLNRKHESELPTVVINIGINSGPALVGLGRLGGRTNERWAYTVRGPTTNLAARITDHANGGQILTSEATAGQLAGKFKLQDRGLGEFKGVSHPVRLFEIEMPADNAAMAGPAMPSEEE